MFVRCCSPGLRRPRRGRPPAHPPERVAWDVIRSTDGNFAYSMPSRPHQESRKAQGAAGSLQIPTYSCSFEESNYRLRRVRSPAEVRPDRVLTELAHLRPRYLTKSARFVKETPIVADGVIGEDLTYTFPSPVGEGLVTARTRHSINDHSYYVMTVTSPPGKPLPEAAARYLSLLTFEAVVRAQYARMTVGPRAPQPPDRPETRARVAIADSTPEEAFRTFFLAVAVGDEATLRAVAQPDAELAWLLRRRPASPEAIGQMKSRLYRITMKRLEPGETARMADGSSRILRPEDIREGRVVLWPEGSSYATTIENIGGHWKVVTRPMITAIKAAEVKEARGRPLVPRSRSATGR